MSELWTIIAEEVEGTARDHRYDVKAFLELYDKAAQKLHPNNEVMCEIRKWLIPIFCRAPGKKFEDFSLSDLRLKQTMCINQIGVFEKIFPGLSKERGTSFQFFRSRITLLYLICRKNHVRIFRNKFAPLRDRLPCRTNEPCGLQQIYVSLDFSVEQCSGKPGFVWRPSHTFRNMDDVSSCTFRRKVCKGVEWFKHQKKVWKLNTIDDLFCL